MLVKTENKYGMLRKEYIFKYCKVCGFYSLILRAEVCWENIIFGVTYK